MQPHAERTPQGWIWYNALGWDYGPYATRREALIRGPQRSQAEQEMLSGKRAV